MFIVYVIIFMVDFACRLYKACMGRVYFVFTRRSTHIVTIMKINFLFVVVVIVAIVAAADSFVLVDLLNADQTLINILCVIYTSAHYKLKNAYISILYCPFRS